MLMVVLLPMVAMTAPLSAAQPPCGGNTTGDTKDCSGANCDARQKLGVSLHLNDEGEAGDAYTTCSNAAAHCETDSYCTAESAVPTNSASVWTCHFESHDVWYYPDSGFTYNCYSYTAAPAPGPSGDDKTNPRVGVRDPSPQPLPSSARPIGCDSLPEETVVANALLGVLCAKLADPQQAASIVVEGATEQMIVYAAGGQAAGVACTLDANCWAIRPVCTMLLKGFACVATPMRAA